MLRKVEFTDWDRESLIKIIITLELNQTKLSNLAGVYQSWLSQVIKGQRTQIDGNLLKKVADSLIETAKVFRHEQKLSDNQLNEIADYLIRFSNNAKDLLPPQISPAGGIIGVNAENYVEIDAYHKIIKALPKSPFACLISGSFQCGKSSLLAQLQKKALEEKIKTVWFNPEKHLPFDLSKEKTDLNSTIAKALSKELSKEWKLELSNDDDIEEISDLLTWLELALKPTKSEKRLLIIDDIGRLGLTSAEVWTREFALDVHNKQSSSNGNLSLAFGMTWGFESNAKRKIKKISSVVNWFPKIELPFFSQNEVNKIINQMKISSNDMDLGKILYKLFKGQPYLTHFAIENPDFHKAVRLWVDNETDKKSEEVIVKSRVFTQRLAAFKNAFLGPTLHWSEDAENLLNSFVEISKNSKTLTLTPDIKEFFNKIKLIDSNGALRIRLDALIAKKLQDDLEEERTQ